MRAFGDHANRSLTGAFGAYVGEVSVAVERERPGDLDVIPCGLHGRVEGTVPAAGVPEEERAAGASLSMRSAENLLGAPPGTPRPYRSSSKREGSRRVVGEFGVVLGEDAGPAEDGVRPGALFGDDEEDERSAVRRLDELRYPRLRSSRRTGNATHSHAMPPSALGSRDRKSCTPTQALWMSSSSFARVG